MKFRHIVFTLVIILALLSLSYVIEDLIEFSQHSEQLR